ncbi:alpha/beta hydrolase [Streptomyces sp. 8K308]|uniref:alpha/beta fold hydrolase n=1 Tax=Streptomyces sp. 8K308 TaxID=2530388 RepID=UPI001044AB7C|nr:alpha/beta hydrolase [Streptomyces sp. 8K308]TDC06907.1 alpha/beta hydrolase [Streptomyces sp. 8K308]
MTRIATGEITTHVQRLDAVRPAGATGEPPVVVFVHGLLTDSLASYYFTLGPAFAAGGVDVIMYDLRGHGRSDRPRTGYRLESFVGDLTGLLDALDERRPVHVVGNSFGGAIAAAFSAWHPDRVATVTLIEAEPPVARWTRHMDRALGYTREQLLRDEVIDWIAANEGAHTARLSRNAGRILRSTAMVEEIPAGRVIADDLSELTSPLLAVFGDDSPLAALVPELTALVPGCRTVVLPDQGHSVLIERPDTTRELILSWIRQHQLAGTAAR